VIGRVAQRVEAPLATARSGIALLPGARARPATLPMLANSIALISGKLATLGLGFVAWIVAARLFPASQVGLAGGAVSAMMLCTQLALLGVSSAVISHYPDHRDAPGRLFDTAFSMVGAAALAAAGIFLLLALEMLRHLHVVAAVPLYAAMFAAMTVLGTVGILLDQLSVTLRRGDQVLSRGVVSGVVTLALVALLPVLGHRDSMAIFAAWVAGGVVMCAQGALQLHGSARGYRYRPRVSRTVARDLFGLGLPNYLLTIAERAPGPILPVIVTELLSPRQNAYWYTVWMMAWVVYVVPISVGITSFAEAAQRPDEMPALMRRALRSSLIIGALAAVATIVLAHFALSLLGPRYAAAGTTPLRILVLAVLPLAFTQGYFAACRARRALGEAIATGMVSLALGVGAAAAVGPTYGLTGMALAWLVVQTATGAFAFFRLRRVTTAPGENGRAVLSVAVAPAPPAQPARRPAAPALRQRLPSARTAAQLVLPAVALGLWIVGLHGIDVSRMTDIGMVSVLPPVTLAAFALIGLSFVLALTRPQPQRWVLALHVVLVIFMLYALPALTEAVPRFHVTYRHAGIIDYITRTGGANPHIDAYFNWPGFFILAGFLVKVAGFHSALSLAAWAPVYFNLAALAPLLLIFRSASRDTRLVWLAALLFYLNNWIGQDYFAPQALTYIAHLVVLAVLLRWFRAGASADWITTRLPRFGLRGRLAGLLAAEEGADAPSTPAQRAALVGIVVVVFAATIPSHQLTPFATMLSVAGLVVVARCRLRGLPLIFGILLISWIAYMTVAYLSGHLSAVTGKLGAVNSTVSTNVGDRLAGSAGHLDVVHARLLMTAALWVLACIGGWRRLRAGKRDLSYVVLALAPFPLAYLQPYGGEIIMRAALFALPFMALFAAWLLYPTRRAGRSPWTTAAAAVLVLATLGAFLVARYGNERMDHFTRAELNAVHYLYRVAPPRSSLLAGAESTQWKFIDYERYHYERLTGNGAKHEVDLRASAPVLARQTAARMRAAGHSGRFGRREPQQSFLLITRSEEAELDMQGPWPVGALARLERVLAHSPRFRLLYRNRDAVVFSLAGFKGGTR
jgi:O-antigen/teichoic acid export membrane protein